MSDRSADRIAGLRGDLFAAGDGDRPATGRRAGEAESDDAGGSILAVQLVPQEVALVGDRLYTDIRMAKAAGAVSVLTLTGETKRRDVEGCPSTDRPDMVVADLGEFGHVLETRDVRDSGGMIANLFSPVRRFFAPPPPAPPLTEAEVQSLLYPSYRLRALEVTYIGYATFYLVRNNVSVVTVEMQHALHYSKEMIGDITAMTGWRTGSASF